MSKIVNEKFKVGFVRNRLPIKFSKAKPIYKEVVIKCPYRLNAMALDPSKIVPTDSFTYTPGEIVFSISLFRTIKLKLRNDGDIKVFGNSERSQLIKHGALLVLKALKSKVGVDIFVTEEVEKRHCGLGSSSGVISAVAIAVNELFGNVIPKNILLKYLAQNHGEEIDSDSNMLQHVQCIGGGAAASLVNAGAMVIAGKSTVIASGSLSDSLSVVIGIPKTLNTLSYSADSEKLMDLEKKVMSKFIRTGKKYGDRIAYRVVHEVIPDLISGDIRSMADLIYDYRFNYGSIKNCAFSFKGLNKIANNISYLYKDGLVELLSLSSVGPAFFAFTNNSRLCERVFHSQGMETFVTKINNRGYKVIKRKR